MKVLHITPMYPTESNPGFGAFVKSQVDSLRPLVDIDLLILPGSGGISPYIKSIPLLKKKLRTEFDVIHVHFGHVATMVKMLYSGKAPVVTSYCGSDLLGKVSDSGFAALKGKNLAKMNKQSSKDDFCSIVKTEELGEQLKGIAENIRIIPNGVDAEVFKEMDSKACKEELGLDTKKKTILFPADPENKIKNFALLKSALSKIESDNIQLISFDSNNRISHNKVPVYINAADLVILTSRHEGSSNVIKESMACNKAAFSTDVGDSKWLLGGVKGSKIVAYDPDSLKDSIEQFFKNDFGQDSNGRAVFFEKGLDVKNIANKIFDIYTSAMEKSI